MKLEWVPNLGNGLDKRLEWANSRMFSTKDPALLLINNNNNDQIDKNNNNIVGIASLHYDSNGIWLNNEIFYRKIHWKIKWLEINPSYKNQGYGTIMINYLKNTFLKFKIPLALYAKRSDTDFCLDLWYFKLGAIILWNEEYPGVMSYQCFMDVNQVPEYIDNNETHNVKEIVEWEKMCSNRRICKREDEDGICGWVLRNNETRCSQCY